MELKTHMECKKCKDVARLQGNGTYLCTDEDCAHLQVHELCSSCSRDSVAVVTEMQEMAQARSRLRGELAKAILASFDKHGLDVSEVLGVLGLVQSMMMVGQVGEIIDGVMTDHKQTSGHT